MLCSGIQDSDVHTCNPLVSGGVEASVDDAAGVGGAAAAAAAHEGGGKPPCSHHRDSS